MGGSPKAAAGILIYRVVEEFQYLLLQASYDDRNWGAPKGHVDPGEELMQTAVRETQEESGLDARDYVIDNEYKFKLEYQANGNPKTVDYWIAKLKNPETPIILSKEHKDYKWVNVDGALSMTYANMGEAIRKVNQYLEESDTQTNNNP